jgi:hypothetical protein
MVRAFIAALVVNGVAVSASLGQPAASGDIVKPRIEIFDERAKAVTFGCDAPAGNVCFFHVLMRLRNVAQRFSIPAGGRYLVTGVIPGIDQYIVTVNQIPPLTMDCRAAPDLQKFCKVSVVGPNYNN